MWGCILMAFTNPGDKILVMSPLYNPYLNSINNSKRQLLSTSLVIKKNRYEIDWEDLKKKIPLCKAMIFCNPHNPSGRIWDKE